MTFVSIYFFLFLLIAVFLFYICPIKYRWITLLISSIVFYVINGTEFIPFILFTSLSIFISAKLIGKFWENQEKLLYDTKISKEQIKDIKEKFKKKRKNVLLIALFLNIAVLSAVKFTKFFVGPINSLLEYLGGEGAFSASMIIVPLGISYYTFSTVGYLLDVYWGKYKYEHNYFRFLLYTSYFPHILQGPIERYNILGNELKKDLHFNFEHIIKGVELMLWGYFKKIVLADRLNLFVSDAFDNPIGNHGLYYLVALIFDVFYIYADFSGCMDIAGGVSEIFGITLVKNFRQPFLAQSTPEFWRRWHITLGAWFKDYVYIPINNSYTLKTLRRNMKKYNIPKQLIKIIVTLIPVFITWILTGLWHGTGKTYIAWGLYYSAVIGASVCFGDLYQNLLDKLGVKTYTFTWKIVRVLKVFIIYLGGRIILTPGSLKSSLYIFENMIFNFNPWIFTNGTFWKLSAFDGFEMIVAIISIILLIAVDLFKEYLGEKRIRDKLDEENSFLRILLSAVAVISIMIFGIYGPEYDVSNFIYTAF